MMLTDDELSTLITGRYADAGLTSPRRRRAAGPAAPPQLEDRARCRAGPSRVAAAGGVAFAVNRHDAAQAAASFDRACQTSYTAEAPGRGMSPSCRPRSARRSSS